MKRTLSLLFTATLLCACSEIPGAAYYNRGTPENLLDVSSELVTISLNSPTSLSRLSSTITQDAPTRAELGCTATEIHCAQAKEILEQHNVPVRATTNGSGVTLVYERIAARDCEQRYIDNSINPYNLNHPTFGCAVTGNTVQMVSDKRQFVSPHLMDLNDDAKAEQSYQDYLRPKAGAPGNAAGPISIIQSGSSAVGQ